MMLKNNLCFFGVCLWSSTLYSSRRKLPPLIITGSMGLGKLAVEKYVNIYSNYYGIPMIPLRYSIVYGPREWYGRVLTVFLKRATEGKLPVVWEGNQIRDFVYVNDVVSLHNLCIKKDEVQNKVW
jgi:nucleoside-diphosphate-sugar epimerase